MALPARFRLTLEEVNLLNLHYQNHDSSEIRERSLIILMYSRGLSIDTISIALKVTSTQVYKLLKVWQHFGTNGLFSDDLQSLYNQVLEREYVAPASNTPKPSILERLTKIALHLKKLLLIFYTYIQIVCYAIWKYIIVGISWLIAKIIAIDLKKYFYDGKQQLQNIVRIGRNSNNNIIFQFNIITQNGETASAEPIITKSFEETKEKIKDIFSSGVSYLSQDRIIALMFAFNEKIQTIKNEERRKRYIAILVTIAAAYIYFHLSIKAGVVMITLLGVTITLFNISSCGKIEKTLNSSPPEVQTSDTLKTTQKPLPPTTPAIDSTEDINDIFATDESCYGLTKISKKQKAYINKDITEYELEKYFINQPDDKFYLHVVAYKDIREAAFQRQHLLSAGYSNCKILELQRSEGPIYAVTIGDFKANEILNLCDLKIQWDEECSKDRAKAIFQPNLR